MNLNFDLMLLKYTYNYTQQMAAHGKSTKLTPAQLGCEDHHQLSNPQFLPMQWSFA